MNEKKFFIGGCTIEMVEYEMLPSERSLYGLNVYLSIEIKCDVWEYFMPIETIRDKRCRGADNRLWTEFIKGEKDVLLKQFVQKLNVETGLNFHVANNLSVPKRVYDLLEQRGCSLDGEDVQLIVYGNNR